MKSFIDEHRADYKGDAGPCSMPSAGGQSIGRFAEVMGVLVRTRASDLLVSGALAGLRDGAGRSVNQLRALSC
jgi:hypothetical protein